MTSGIPQRSVFGPVLFNICVSNKDSGIECTLSCFAKDTKLCGAVDMPEEGDTIQRDLDRLEKWAHANLRKFNKAKCKVLHMDQGKAKHKYRLGEAWIVSSPGKKDLGMLVDEKRNVTQQCVLATQKANHILGCTKRNMASRWREVIVPLCSGDTPPGVLHPAVDPCIQLWSPQHRKDGDLLE